MTGDTEGGGEGPLSRRDVLKATSGAIAVGAASGVAAGNDRIEVNVGFENSMGAQAIAQQAEEVKKEFDSLNAMTVELPEQALAGLQADQNIKYVERNGQMEALQTTPYGIEKVEADLAIDDGDTGAGVSVAVIDTGVDAQHETLEPHLGEGYAPAGAACQDDCDESFTCRPNDISTCYAEWDDDNDHGTHVAGTVGALDNGEGVLGVAPDVTIHPVKVLDCCGSGGYDDIAAGIEWSADQGVDVINMSLGGDESNVVNDAVEYAAEQGVVIVAAAGNDGDCTDCVGHPAAHPEVIAVSATDENDDLADFSSTGPEVELAAPGVDVLSAVPRDDYAEFPGTSMASPHVAGGAAQVIAAGTTGREAVRQVLQDSADDIGLPDNEQGYGRLNVADAIDADGDDGDDDDEDDDDDGEESETVDPTLWPAGTGNDGYENIDEVDLGGQVVESSGDNAYEDFTAPEAAHVSPGGDLQVSMAWDDNDYDEHYANIYVDWDQNEDFSTAQETVLLEDADDSSSTATATVDVPADAEPGATLLRVRLSWQGFDDADATDEWGEVNDFSVYVDGEDDDDDGDEPTVSVSTSTDSASGVGESLATLNGSLDELDNADSADVSFEYGVSGEGLQQTVDAGSRSSTGSFDASVSGLESGTEYEFRAVAEAEDEVDQGEVRTFSTDAAPASVGVSTDGATSVGENTATLNGTLTELENADSATVWFEYGESGSGLLNATADQTLYSTGSFDASLSNLDDGTTYEYQAIAQAGDDEDTGTVRSFTTDEEEDDSGGCFITTATHREQKTLDSLRRFRDDSMKETPVGRGMVGLYYRISPPIADTLDRHPESRTASVTRKLIQTCASLSNEQDQTSSTIKSAGLGVLLTMLYIVGIMVAATGHAGIRTLELFS